MKEVKILEELRMDKLQREYVKNNTILRLLMESDNKSKIISSLGEDAFNEIIDSCCYVNETLFKLKRRSVLCWF